MHAYPRWKLWLILAVLLISLLASAPNVMTIPSWWPASFSKPINLGLDLKGGIHLVVDVDVDKAIELAAEKDVDGIKQALRQNKMHYGTVEAKGNQIFVQVRDAAESDGALKLIQSEFSGDYSVSATDATHFTLTLRDERAKEMKKNAVDQGIEVIRTRIDALGTTEPVIIRQGDRRIVVQIPGYEDTEHAKSLIKSSAVLEFKLVDEQGDLDKALQGAIPPGDIVMYSKDEVGPDGKLMRQPYLLKKRTELSGGELSDARVSLDSRYNEYAVTLKFDNVGARKFDRLTSEHVGERFAIILEGKVMSAPVIRERISGGTAQITGSFTPAEAHDLAIVLRAGALPAPVKVVEERSVGPSLGQDSIDQGVRSIVIGSVLVFLFMGVYYRLFGMVANITLVFNVLLIVAAMSLIGSTLTLPGLAGILLTVGIAVDANVLIYERIREEVRNGRTPLAAIDAGFDRAFVTIIDSHVTSLIAALVLFQFGTGPVKGFAVTLTVGLLASLFTSITVTRAIISLTLEGRGRVNKLVI